MPEPIELRSDIRRVEVYREQALVTRGARLSLADRVPELELRLTGLPLGLVDGSVRLVVDKTGSTRVQQLRVEVDLGAVTDEPRTEAARAVREARRRRTQVLVEEERLRARLALLESLTANGYNLTELPEALELPVQPRSDRWLALAAFVREELTRRRSELRALERKRREIEDGLAATRHRMDRESEAARAAVEAAYKAVRARLSTDGATGVLELELSYLVSPARWLPEYEVRVFSARPEAELVVRALLAQRTGEDWPRCELALSSANLQRSSALPELESWRIGRAQPSRRSGWRELPDTLGELFEGYDRDQGQVPTIFRAASIDLPEIPAWLEQPPLPLPRPQQAPSKTPNRLGATTPLAKRAVAEPCGEPVPERAAPPPSPPAQVFSKSLPAPASRASAPSRARRQAPPQPGDLAGRAAGELDGFSQERAKDRAPVDAPAQVKAEVQAEVVLCLKAEALAYDQLRMVPPEGSGRGELRPSDEAAALPSARGRQDLPAAPAGTVALEQSASHFAVRYAADSPAEVAADGQFHTLTVARRPGAALRLFRCVPRVDPQVYQLALFSNPLGVPLLAGPVRIYLDGDFVVCAALDTAPAGKQIAVNLGIEPGIVVARNTRFRESTGGLLGGDTVLHQEIEIEARSRLLESVSLEIFERIPISGTEDIRVELVETRPAAERYDQQDRGCIVRGGYRFRLELPPGETRRCSLSYKITLPSKQLLVGGNRRD